jgi:hypothetical protein
MNLQRALILLGIVAILLGWLVPISQQGGGKSFYPTGRTYGSFTYVLFALIAAFAALAMKKDGMLWVFGLIILGMLINDFRITWQQVADTDGARLSWGWLLLFNGALMMSLTLFLGEDRERLVEPVRHFFIPLNPDAPFELDDEEADEEEPDTDISA